MRARFTGIAALAAAIALGSPAWASTRAAAPLTDRYCTAVTEYYTISIVVEFTAALVDAFSQLPGVEDEDEATDDETQSTTTTTKQVTSEDIRATFLVVMSPKLAELTRRLAGGGPKVLRTLFRRQRAAFQRGVELLRDAGLPKNDIELIANADVNSATNEVEDLSDDVHIDDTKAQELGEQFKDELDDVTFEDLTARQEQELERIGIECGAFPDPDVACNDAMPAAEAEAILGGDATTDGDRCEYEGPEPFEGQRPTLAVVVYGSDRALDTLTEPLTELVTDKRDVHGVGDQALSFKGYSADGHGITCGRTLVATADDRTIVVALCLGDDAEVTDEQLVEIGQGVIDRLAEAT